MNVFDMASFNLRGNWHKGSVGSEEQGYCVLGHVYAVCDERGEEYTDEWDFADLMAEKLWPERINSDNAKAAAAQFNDHPDTTEDEAREFLNMTAREWDNHVALG